MKRASKLLGSALVCVVVISALPAAAGGNVVSRADGKVLGFAPKGGTLSAYKAGLTGAAGAAGANWTPIANMPTAVQETGGGTYVGNRFYVPGGFVNPATPVLTDAMQVYDPATNSWSLNDPLPAGPWGDAAVCSEPNTGTVFVVNGVDGQFLYSSLQIFNPAAPAGNRWSFGPFPATAADNVFFSQASGCAVLGNNLYLFGGFAVIGDPNDPGLAAAPTKATWKLDLISGIWSDTGQVMKTARFWFGYAGAGNAAGVAGGVNNLIFFTPLTGTERFSPATGWSTLPNMPQGRIAPGMGVLFGNVAIFGGLGTSTTFSTTLRCAISAGCPSWTDAGRNLNTARSFTSWGTGTGAAANQVFVAGGANNAGNSINSSEKLP